MEPEVNFKGDQNIKSLLLNPLNRRDRLRNLFVNFLLSRTKNKL